MFAAVKSGNDVEVARVIVEGCYGGGGSRVWVLVFRDAVHDVRDGHGEPW
jgi:hypothetical protein